MDRAPRGRPTPATALAVGSLGLLLVNATMVYSRISLRYTYEDQTVLWTVARNLRDGNLHALDFPGQFYGSSLEAFPAALFGAMGATDATAFALTLLILMVVPWICLATSLYCRLRSTLAWLVALLPVVMATEFTAITLMWATAAPRAIAILAASAGIAPFPDRTRTSLFVGLAGVALVFDQSTGLLLAPVGAWMLLTGLRPRIRIVAVALAPTGALLAALAVHHRAHEAFDLHPAPSRDFSLSALEFHARNPTLGLRHFGPELAWSPALRVAILLGAALLLLAAAIRTRKASVAVPLIVLGAAALGFASLEGSLRSAEFATVMPSIGRGLMALPAALAFCGVVIAAESDRARARPALIVGVVLAVGLASTILRAAGPGIDDFTDEIQATEAINVWRLDDLLDVCAAASELDQQPQFMISTDSTVAYACSALDRGVRFVFPPYERRTWEFEAALSAEQAGWVVWGRGWSDCGDLADGFRCVALGSELTLAEGGDMTDLAEAAGALGLGLRPYAPETRD